MTETVLPISPEIFWGAVNVGLFLIACLAVGAMLNSVKPDHVAPLVRLKRALGLRKLNSGLFLIALLMWGIVAFLLITGLIWTVWDIIWQALPANDSEFWDWRFALVKLTALTATLGAVVAFPITMQRLRLTQLQTSTASEALFNDKINVAANDLHAQRQVTINPENADKRVDIWQDDIVKRNAAIDQLEILVQERPDTAHRVARMLSTYVRELSKEFKPLPVPEEDSLKVLKKWASSLKPCRPDMENAVQTLGRLKAIKGVDPDAVKIDLRGANLQGFNLDDAVLDGANLEDVHLQGARFYKAKMRETNLRGAHIQGAYAIYMDARGTHFDNAKMQAVDFFEADLREAYFNNAELQASDLHAAKMQGAVLYNTNLQGAMFVSTEMGAETFLGAADLQGAMLQSFDASKVEFDDGNALFLYYDKPTSDTGNLVLNNSQGSTPYTGNTGAIDTFDTFDGGFKPAWRDWQKSIGFDPDTYQA